MEIKNNAYLIQGVDLNKVVKEFDSPVYVYDANKIIDQLTTLKNAFSNQKIRIKYAAKALTNISILKLMKKHGAGVDVVSVQEAKLAVKAGFEPGDILFTPNCVSFEEIQQGVEMGLTINIDNISILEQFGHKYHNSVPCCIRLNPHIMAGGNSKISTGHVDSKFGISIYQLPHLLRVIKTNNIDVIGLHMHTGSDILDAEVFLKIADILYGVARDFPNLEFIDFGSGFKVGYKENDITTNVYDLGVKLSKSFDKFCESYGRKLEMWFEPGKYLVSESGYFLVKANVIKTTPATVFVGVDSGMNHLLRPMMYDAYHEIINISNPKGTQRVYTIVGYICETDTFGWDRKLNEVREGDILAIKNAGAYGFSMASNYNSRYRPAEVLIYEGKAHLIRERETMDDILRNQVEIDI
ncbi:diaminopimelate decarboxylase [Fulvivirga ulvae]|uniref:diaminopimelate decarboxylase n=1 Tax=Fulvivirga ulvae TaxID=2904245 RepID=UPI001F1C63FC|nr:diaminopimelate decarboxylase [Fulvivirga ulvae]UII33797.1 diaminopimelate decarboxylase [Fulvivirga ulvae]